MYSPISPINRRIIPEKKHTAATIVDHPIGTAGRSILLMMTATTPIRPITENRQPSLVATRSGTMEKPMMFDQSWMSFFIV